MTQTRGRKAFAVVVNHHRAVDNLVAAVLIHVCDAVVVVAVAVPWVVPAAVVRPLPAERQFVGGRVDVVGRHLVARVDAAGKKQACLPAVEHGSTEEIFAGSVTVVVTPGTGTLTGQWVIDDLVWFSVCSVEIDQVFRSCVCVGHVGGVGHAVAGVHVKVTDALIP